MPSIFVVIGAILQVVILLLKSHYEKESDIKKEHANNSKKISDAIASGDISRINDVIGGLRK